MDTDLFFAGEDDYYPNELAKRTCDMCPMRTSCLNYAIETNEWGIWGGLTKRQRDAMKRARNRSSCPSCGSEMLPHWDDGDIQVCAGCGLTWETGQQRAS